MFASSNRSNSINVTRSLKGLLMDKGAGSCETKLRNTTNKMYSVQSAMVELVALQKSSRELNQCECMDLYLATNLRREHAGRSRMVNPSKLTPFQTKAAPVIEWRTRPEFAREFGYPLTARLFPFKSNHPHHIQVRDFVDKTAPNYYQVLSAYETARLSLNCALKSLRKIALDIHSVGEESEGIDNVFTNDSLKTSQRIIEQVDVNSDIREILTGLYA